MALISNVVGESIGPLVIDYVGTGRKAITLSFVNQSTKSVPWTGSKSTRGFALRIRKESTQLVQIPLIIKLWESNSGNLPPGAEMSAEFSGRKLPSLPPGTYSLDGMWERNSTLDWEKADLLVVDLNLTVTEGGNWEISSDAKTRVYSNGQFDFRPQAVRIFAPATNPDDEVQRERKLEPAIHNVQRDANNLIDQSDLLARNENSEVIAASKVNRNLQESMFLCGIVPLFFLILCLVFGKIRRRRQDNRRWYHIR